jgi:hypothetical protein
MEAVAHMIPVAFGAAVSPVVLIVNVLLLSGHTRPLARGAAYAIGCAIIIVGFGVAGVTIIKGVATAPRDVAAGIHFAVGAISLTFAARALIRGPSPPSKKEGVTPADEQEEPTWRFALAGLGAMGINMTTLTMFLTICAELVRAPISYSQEFIGLAIADVIILLPVWGPLLLTVVAPAVARRIFGPMNDFLTRHEWGLQVLVPGGFGVYLLTLGVVVLT